ncbi:septum formation initiator, partial [Bifidobacteriaceae bacterium NR021]
MVMKKRRKTALGEDVVSPLQQRRLLSGPLVFLFMVFVVTVGSIECISTVR